MDSVIGIDLGTTNCCVAIVADGRPRVLEDERGYPIQPSYVAVEGKGRYIVGHPAKTQVISNPKNTLYGVKRIIGRKFESPEVDAVRRRVSYEIVPGPSLEAEVRAGGIQLTPTEVSGILLKNMREVASRALGHEVRKAVVTVPAYFNHAQRKSTIEAGATAGLEILRLINEPTAAALAYGYRKDIERRILVFDLGGGTFDVSLLEVGNDVYEVLTTNGDTFLGGNDFDNVLVDHLIERFRQAEGIDLRGDRQAMQRLKDASEKAKCELSFTDRTQILIPQIHGRANLHADLTREELEALTKPLIERCMAVVRKTLSEASMSPQDVDDVILVGGQPRMPSIQRFITEYFGKAPSKGVHPDEAVAVGAAIHAASLGSDESGLLLLDVTPFSLGIDSVGDIFSSVINKNATIPVSEKRTFTTVRDNQSEVHIVVRQGESRKASENNFLGEFLLEGIPPAARMSPKIDVTFRIDSNGILSVAAKDQATGERQAIAIREYARLASDGGSAERDEALMASPESQAPVEADGKGGGGFFSKLAKSFSFGKKGKEEAAKAPAVVEIPEDEDFDEDDFPDLGAGSGVDLPSMEGKVAAGAPPHSTADLPEASALKTGDKAPAASADISPEALEELSDLDDLALGEEELSLEPAAEIPEPKAPSGGELFAFKPPQPTVGESPVDPFDAQEIEDLLGSDWANGPVSGLDLPAAPPSAPSAEEEAPEHTGQIDLQALEEALSDLDFELPESDGDIDLESLSTVTRKNAADLPFEVDDDPSPAGADPFDLAQEVKGGSEPFAIAPKAAADPFAIAPKAAADPFAIAPKEAADPFAIAPKAAVDPYAITPKVDAPAAAAEVEPFAIEPLDNPFADLASEIFGDPDEKTGAVDPFGLIEGEDDEDDDVLAAFGSDGGDGGVFGGDGDEDEDDPFGILDKELARDLESWADPSALDDDAGEPSITGELDEEDPFRLDGDFQVTIRSPSPSDRTDSGEITGSFDMDTFDLEVGEGAVDTIITPPSEQTQALKQSRARLQPEKAPEVAEADPFGIIDRADFNLGDLVGPEGDIAGFGDVPPDPFDLPEDERELPDFGDIEVSDPFGARGPLEVDEEESFSMDLDLEGDDPFGITDHGAAVFGAADASGDDDAGDDPFGMVEREGDGDDPFGALDASDVAGDDPFGMIDRDAEAQDPFGMIERDADAQDPFGMIDRGDDPSEPVALTSKEEGGAKTNGSAAPAELVTTRIILPKAGGGGLARVNLSYGRVDTFVKQGKESLSQAGAFLTLPNPLAVGSACEVEMAIPGIGESVVLRGQVVWSSKGRVADTEGMGIQYDLNHDGGGDRLRRLLADLEA